MGIMICPNCGGKVSTTRSNCPHCNYVFKKKICPDCNEEVLEGVKECSICGHYFVDTNTNESLNFKARDELINESSVNEIEEDKTISTKTLDGKVEENNNVEKNTVTNNITSLNPQTKLECPYCKSNDLMMIGINYYMCYVCKNKFLDIYSNIQTNTNSNSIQNNSVLSPIVDNLQNDKKIEIDNKSVEVSNDLNEKDNKKSQIESISISDSKNEKNTIKTDDTIEQDDNITTDDFSEKKKTNIFKRINRKLIILISVILVLIAGGVVTTVVLLNHYDDIADNIDEYEYYVEDGNYYVITGVKNRKITNAIIPNIVTSIGKGAFDLCESLTSIEIPNSVTSIEDFAFAHCFSLTNITIPNSVTSIGKGAFYGCGLKSITIPNSVTYVGDEIFENCSLLESVTLPFIGQERPKSNDSNYHFYDFCGPYVEVSEIILTDCEFIPQEAFLNCHALTSITIPNTVKSLNQFVFAYCDMLTNVYYGGTIEDWCNITIEGPILTNNSPVNFYFLDEDGKNYKLLTEFEIPSTISSIGYAQFGGFNKLKKITIPTSVTSIGAYAFYDCSSLTSIEIPNSVTSIGVSAFALCESLKNVYYKGTQEEWRLIEKDYIYSIICFYSEEAPTDSGDYWHYVDGLPVKWE